MAPAQSDAPAVGADAIIQLSDVIRVYRESDVETIALRGVDLQVARGEFVAIMGRSGSGKSTLLGLLAGADRPTAGRVMVDGIDLSRASEVERAALRGRRVGMVFQSGNLIPFLDLAENLELAATLADHVAAKAELLAVLDRVALAGREHHRPGQLSGGEQQRAAIALVVATRVPILLADEITGELDSAHATQVLDLLVEIHRVGAIPIVLATHDPAVAARADRVVELRAGRVLSDGRAA